VPLIIIPPENCEYDEHEITDSLLEFAPNILEAANADYRAHSHGTNILG